MKKIIPIVSISALVVAGTANFISVNVGDKDGHKFLGSLKDFDWKDINYGDGLEYQNDSEATIQLPLNNQPGIRVKGSQQDYKNFVDYSKFSTWFQNSDGIRKQAVTGVPLNEGFMPNGNYASDFGVTSKAQKYVTRNSILDWNVNDDKDARFNRSYTPLRKSIQTAFAYPNKNKEMKFDYLGFSSRKHRTFDNTVVGTRNPFEGTNLNWQYTSTFINWSGSWFEGPIVPPPADTIDIAHNNGTPIYGNIFLDGSHGLTRQMLRDFVAKDKDGNYLVVDFLLKLAEYNGFDGYFLNDESNGFDPNGTVLDYTTLVDIVKQFNKKSIDLNLNKKIMFYRAWGTLSKVANDYADKETYAMSQSMPDGTPMDIQLDFGEVPNKSQDFLEEHKNYKASDLYSIYNLSNPGGGYVFSYGTYDWRNLGYGLDGYDPDRKEMIYNKDIYSSISGYMDDGSATFGTTALDILNNSKNKKLKELSTERKFLFANQVSNLYNDTLFNGLNNNPTDNDKGADLNNYNDDYSDIPSSIKGNIQYEFLLNDPRIYIDKTDLKSKSKDAGGLVKKLIYDYADNNGLNSKSYGVGNLIQEKTVFEDEDNPATSIKTDFSTGSGIQFVNRDSTGEPKISSNYPFTNKRIADILPTYQWDINEIGNDEVNNLSSIDPLNTKKTAIDKLSGFYDYDDVYAKSNSIAIGSNFNEEGKISDGAWDTNKSYIWNIMGTNVQKNDHNFSFTYKDNDGAEIKPIFTLTEDAKKNEYRLATNVKSTAETSDHWKTVTFTTDGINLDSNLRLSKVGLLITPKKENFKLNVGEFSMDMNNNEVKATNYKNNLSSFEEQYRIERNNLINLRFTYETNKQLGFDYIEFYIKSRDDKWYRVGETIANEYFIKDIDKNKFGNVIDLAAVTYKDGQIIAKDRYEIE